MNDIQLWPPRQRRKKYTAEACAECKRRKIKCTGEQPCRACKFGRNRKCTYDGPASYRRQKTRVIPERTKENHSSTSSNEQPDGAIPQTEEANSVGFSESFAFMPYHLHDNQGSFLAPGCICNGHAQSVQEPSDTGPESDRSPGYISSRLFSEPNLDFLLCHFFDELEYFFPMIDRAHFYGRLSTLFSNHMSYEKGIFRVPAQREHAILAALTCGMLSIATYLGAGAEPFQRLQGDDYHIPISRLWYSESRRLLTLYPSSEIQGLDLLCIRVLDVIYMNMLQRTGDLSEAMALAVDISFRINLNNEETWTPYTSREQEHRRLLWWTVFYLDRQVALGLGRPYLIRDVDFIVSGFTEKSRESFLSNGLSDFRQIKENIPWQFPSNFNEDWFDYVQSTVKWSKIATRVWDSFFALRAAKTSDTDNVEVIEALLMKLQSDLPSSLVYNLKKVPSVIKVNSEDRAFRLQLMIFERIHMLRLLVCSRYTQGIQGEAKVATETARKAQEIASAVIDSIIGYLIARKKARVWITYGTLALARASTYIAPILKGQQLRTAATHDTIASIARACKGLQDIAEMKVKTSHFALACFNTLLDEHLHSSPERSASTLDSGRMNIEDASLDNAEFGDRYLYGLDDQSNWGLEEFLAGGESEEWLSLGALEAQ